MANKLKELIKIKIEDKQQDLLELTIFENGVIAGYSIMFSNNRLSLLGIGSLNGTKYYSFEDLKEKNFQQKLKGLYIYLRETGKKEPLPWEAMTLKYKIV